MTVVRSTWAMVEVDPKNMIFFIEDICHLTGEMSITNDAENVCNYFRVKHGKGWRVVYKDTDGEWWEIVMTESRMSRDIGFRPWHGVVWDTLQRIES
jgi:hypothetical protein